MPRNLNNITQTNGYTVVKPNIPLEWSSMYMAKTNQGTGDCGKIIPVYHKELIPNQTININQSVALQFTPFVSNLFHQIKGELMSFFVPYRICAFMRAAESIDDDLEYEADQLQWQGYITGGKTGEDNRQLDSTRVSCRQKSYGEGTYSDGSSWIGTLDDYFGFPNFTKIGTIQGDEDAKLRVNNLLHNAYNLIYNTKFRNPDYTPAKLGRYAQQVTSSASAKTFREFNETATAYWNADRFTRARKAQYRGIAPTIPINNELVELAVKLTATTATDGQTETLPTQFSDLSSSPIGATSNSTDGSVTIGLAGSEGFFGETRPKIKGEATIPANTIQSNLDYNEFIYNLAILKYETNNARIKPLYVEHLKYRFGIIPQDSRFQEPEWISSNSFNIGIDINQATAGTTQISESGETLNYTQNDQGKITSQGWGSGQNLKSEYKAMEHGIFMTLMIIRPEGVYEGGLDRRWWGERTRFDFPTPELMNLPDQKIWKGELKYTNSYENNKTGFGWEQIFDEFRTDTNQVCGILRPSEETGLTSYTLARYWNENQPELNDEFLKCKPDMERIKQYINQPDFIFFVRSEMKTALPMPIINEPINIGM